LFGPEGLEELQFTEEAPDKGLRRGDWWADYGRRPLKREIWLTQQPSPPRVRQTNPSNSPGPVRIRTPGGFESPRARVRMRRGFRWPLRFHEPLGRRWLGIAVPRLRPECDHTEETTAGEGPPSDDWNPVLEAELDLVVHGHPLRGRIHDAGRL
jgi:hypothetical protein